MKTIMIRNGLDSLIAVAIDGMDVEVGGVLILRDGHIHGGDSFVFYTGTHDSSDGRWKGEMIRTYADHTVGGRAAPAHQIQRDLQRRGCRDATALVGKQ